jgi:phenylacetate-CoA ligase
MKYRVLNYFNEKIFFPLGDFLLGTSFIAKLKQVRDISALSESQLLELQNMKLRKLLEYACSKTSYYASTVWKRDENIIISLKRFPILTKSVLRREGKNLLTMPIENCILYETSGSSGVATSIYVDKQEESLFRAILINWWEWTGYYLGKPILQTGMTTKRGILKSLKDIVSNTVYLNAFQLNEAYVVSVLKKLKKKSDFHFGGYASSLYVIAQIAEKYSLQLQFSAVISWGDKMFPHYKEKIERVFKTKVYENYACNEGIMIGQKVDLPFYYIYTPNVFLEILDDDGNEVKDGEMGRVIVTKLDGYAMPLIRYETGDLAVKLPRNKYPSHRKFNFPLLEKVVGRDTDIIKTPEGNSLIVHTFTGIFEFYKEIEQFRIIQSKIEAFVIEYIPAPAFYLEILSIIEEDIRSKTKTSMGIEWKEVAQITPTKSGKPQIIQNDLIKAARSKRDEQ